MEIKTIKNKVLRILDTSPELKAIMLSPYPVELKRKRIRDYLNDLNVSSYYDESSVHSLETIQTRDAIQVFKSILSVRNEHLAKHSLLNYLNDLLHKESLIGIEKPRSGFFAEIDHLLKGIMGESAIYQGKAPAFVKYEGQKAARLRSADLSRMSRIAERFIERYPCGLDRDALRRRAINKSRILRYFSAAASDWEDWKWHTRHIIRDADTLKALVRLSEDDEKAIRMARKNKIPFGITPYYLSLMDYGASRHRDYAIRYQVIPTLHYVTNLKEFREKAEHSLDFMLERDTSPIEGITRRYPMIVILKPVMTCPQICVYCQRNWEIEDVYSRNAVLSKGKIRNAVQWIENTPEINEVLITGGDPFILSNNRIEKLLGMLAQIKHIQRIRIGTRTPVTLPQRIDESLANILDRFHIPGKREIMIVTHFEHPYEITPSSMEAVQRLRKRGMDVYNQLVYTTFNSKKFEAAALRLKLRLIGVTPYYTFNTKGKKETDEYRVPISRLLQEQQEEARLLPGTVRTDEIVFNVPKLGKNYLRALQHHDVISILPNGCRVYEFHPWEKKLSLVDTYIYTDVSIYNYLKALKKAGENLTHYKTIWYYY